MENKNKSQRYIGKVRNTATKNGGVNTKIYMDSLSSVNQDGTPNPYYKGILVWCDAETGKQYQVKQLSVFAPKNGMNPKLQEKGYSHNVTINLEDEYEVTLLD